MNKELTNRLAIYTPIILIAYVLFLDIDIWNQGSTNKFEVALHSWRNYRNIIFLLLYVPLFLVNALHYSRLKTKTVKSLFVTYKSWLLGVFLLIFSFALAGLILDIGYVFVILFSRL